MGALADALRGGGKFIKWDDLGQGVVVGGTVTNVAMRQTRKIKKVNGQWIDEGPATWDDGGPKMEAAIELDTQLRDNADDDGARTVTVNLWSGQKSALRDACKAADVAEPTPGDTFEAVWVSGAGEAGDPRVFRYRITKGSGVGAALADPFAGQPVDPFEAASTPAAVMHPAPAAPQPVAQPAQPAAPQPVAQPAPAPAAASKPDQVKALHAAGLDVDTIATATGYSREAVAALINLG